MPPRPPLNEVLALFQATVAAEGTTTGAGAVAGNSFIDVGLIGFGVGSFEGMLAIVYPGQPNLIDSFDIPAGGFNNVTGEVTLNHNYKGGQIPAGVAYKIASFRFVPAEVAALQADVGDASTATLGSLFGILGDPAQDFLTMIGYEGATSLANKLTAARAAYLDELDFDLQGTLATIAGYIDTEIAAILADIGDASGATLGSILGILGDPAQSFLAMIGYEGATSLAGKLTAARAGYLDELANAPNIQHETEWATIAVVEQVANAAAVNLTAGSITPTFPTGSTRVRAILISSIHVANQAANTHHIDIKVQGQKAAGGYTDLLDLTAQDSLGLVNLDGAADGWCGAIDVTAKVDASGSVYDFRFVVDSDNAGAVNYTTSFVLVLVYTM